MRHGKAANSFALRYAGDEINTKEKLQTLNEKESGKYTEMMVLEMDFKTGKKAPDTLEAEKEYTDYQWTLGCDKEGSWEIVGSELPIE